MDFFLPLAIPKLRPAIRHSDRLLLIGSCFTEHIATRLAATGFRTCSNPQGILFNPQSTAQALRHALHRRQWQEEDVFELNGLWNSWQHHSRFSHPDRKEALCLMQKEADAAHRFLEGAEWVIVTLGTSYQYVLRESGRAVANNHRAPGSWFEKRLLTTQEIVAVWRETLDELFDARPSLRVIFTVSPVRHARDGAVANNRSKGRLLDAVHTLCEQFGDKTYYFPSYELVVDVLRDYRFYDIDLAHPNHAATQYVWERFTEACIDPAALQLMERVSEISIAKAHRPRFPQTAAHGAFRNAMRQKITAVQVEAPWLDLSGAAAYFED